MIYSSEKQTNLVFDEIHPLLPGKVTYVNGSFSNFLSYMRPHCENSIAAKMERTEVSICIVHLSFLGQSKAPANPTLESSSSRHYDWCHFVVALFICCCFFKKIETSKVKPEDKETKHTDHLAPCNKYIPCNILPTPYPKRRKISQGLCSCCSFCLKCFPYSLCQVKCRASFGMGIPWHIGTLSMGHPSLPWGHETEMLMIRCSNSKAY